MLLSIKVAVEVKFDSSSVAYYVIICFEFDFELSVLVKLHQFEASTPH